MKELRLEKSGHIFVIRFEPGSEQLVYDHLAEMVQRREVPFDWFDAAVMSSQIGKAEQQPKAGEP